MGPTRAILVMGLFLLAAFGIALLLDRVIPLRPSRRS